MLVSVDLPIPGDPPSSTSEPGTNPPPSTRSSSPIPVDIRFTAEAPTSCSGIGPILGAPGRPAPPRGLPAADPRARAPARGGVFKDSATSVFQASQPGHCPCHLADWKPHSEHTWTVVRAIQPEYVPSRTAQSAPMTVLRRSYSS